MKKIFITLALAAAMCACSNSDKTATDSSVSAEPQAQEAVAEEQTPALDDAQKEELTKEITERLTAYYSGKMLPNEFGSKALNKAVDDANAKDAQMGGEVGFFDFDIFSFEQDYCKGCGIQSIEILSPESAKATIHLSAPSSDVHDVELTMIKEDGKWVADDVQWLPVSTYPQTVRAQVVDFLNQ